jgi:starch-binding outer membrane protein, SusD/RagB family
MTMKFRQLIWIALVGLAACDNPLNTDPTAQVDASTALTSARGIELAMNGAYRALQSGSLYTRVELAFGDMYADNLNFTGTFTGDREVSTRQILPSNGEVGGIWSSAYVGVNRANYILDALPNVSDLTDDKRKQYRGEALWIRGLMYSLLVKYYGGVPLVDQPSKGVDESMFKERASLAESYAFIVKDLEEAATLLSPARSNGRATQGAANAILARVYLEMGQNEKARDKATSLINNSAYRLVPSLREFFTNKNGTESIYEVQHTVANSNSAAFWFFPPTLGGRLGFAPAPGLINAFEPGDTRRAASIATAGSQAYGFKYYRIATGDDNIPVARLAEQYLIRAEANARLNAAPDVVRADINVIRTRSGLQPLPTTVTAQQALLDAILQERRVELAMEGFRFADLRRHGKAQALLGISTDKLLWPLPQYERDVNPKLAQNPGY